MADKKITALTDLGDSLAAAAGNTVNATLTYASGVAVSKTVSS